MLKDPMRCLEALRAAKRAARTSTILLVKRARRPSHHLIHIPKNAGMALRQALAYRVSLSEPYHYRYIDIVDRFGRGLKYFAIVRNPWSRTVSRYLYARQRCETWPADDPRRAYMSTATFSDFVRDARVFEIPAHPGMPWMGPTTSWYDQLEWMRDERGRVMCDALRFEHLEDDLSTYFGQQIRVPEKNRTRQSMDYRRLYTDDLAQCVASRFARDIEHFGFTFDGPATKGIAIL
jgi:hypothetical protein